MRPFDHVVVGAGLSGAVIAERIASVAGGRVLVVEARDHVAGNCHDYLDRSGVFVHRYGPHIFHTDRQEVWDYLSRFTAWLPYQHRVLAQIDGRLAPLPFNLNTLHQVLPETRAVAMEMALLERYAYGERVPILKLREADESLLRELAGYVFDKVFRGYSRKQWGMDPADLDPAVTGRVPVLISRDDRYFQDPYQGIPAAGYTAMVQRMLDHPGIKLMLNTSMEEVLEFDADSGAVSLFGQPFAGTVVYTGMVDALFGYRYGRLPYRSLRFELESVADAMQSVATVNYPNDYAFTRITQFGHFIGRQGGPDVIMREYPKPYEGEKAGEGMPYYPVFTDANQGLFERYGRHAEGFDNLILLGRLAEYKYYDMDDAVAKALDVARTRFGGSV